MFGQICGNVKLQYLGFKLCRLYMFLSKRVTYVRLFTQIMRRRKALYITGFFREGDLSVSGIATAIPCPSISVPGLMIWMR